MEETMNKLECWMAGLIAGMLQAAAKADVVERSRPKAFLKRESVLRLN